MFDQSAIKTACDAESMLGQTRSDPEALRAVTPAGAAGGATPAGDRRLGSANTWHPHPSHAASPTSHPTRGSSGSDDGTAAAAAPRKSAAATSRDSAAGGSGGGALRGSIAGGGVLAAHSNASSASSRGPEPRHKFDAGLSHYPAYDRDNGGGSSSGGGNGGGRSTDEEWLGGDGPGNPTTPRPAGMTARVNEALSNGRARIHELVRLALYLRRRAAAFILACAACQTPDACSTALLHRMALAAAVRARSLMRSMLSACRRGERLAGRARGSRPRQPAPRPAATATLPVTTRAPRRTSRRCLRQRDRDTSTRLWTTYRTFPTRSTRRRSAQTGRRAARTAARHWTRRLQSPGRPSPRSAKGPKWRRRGVRKRSAHRFTMRGSRAPLSTATPATAATGALHGLRSCSLLALQAL